MGRPCKIAASHGGSGPPSDAWFPEPTRVLDPNSISIGSAVFARRTTVTDRQTDRPRCSVCNNWPRMCVLLRYGLKTDFDIHVANLRVLLAVGLTSIKLWLCIIIVLITEAPFTLYILLSNGLSWQPVKCLYSLHDTTGCETYLTTGCIVYNPVWQPMNRLNKQCLFVQHGWTNSGCSFNRLSNRVWQPVECLFTRYSRLSNRL